MKMPCDPNLQLLRPIVWKPLVYSVVNKFLLLRNMNIMQLVKKITNQPGIEPSALLVGCSTTELLSQMWKSIDSVTTPYNSC